MNIELRPAPPAIEKTDVQIVYVGGRAIGEVRRSLLSTGAVDYHAVLNTGAGRWLSGLVMGHGSTPDEAIRDAFTGTAALLDEYVSALRQLESLVMGSEVVA